jgi:phosphoribosylaminoimidazole (AIR) synthetase
LIGGETAEMPGMYGEDDYDLAGFTVGIAEKRQMITGEKIQAGDVLVGLPSSGIHSNGYSLVRKVFFEINSFALDEKLPELSGKLSDEILTPTRIYVEAVLPLVYFSNALKIGNTGQEPSSISQANFSGNMRGKFSTKPPPVTWAIPFTNSFLTKGSTAST